MCEYCKGNKCLKGNEDESYYKIENNILIHEENCIDSFYSYTDEININYCPMCGRKLENNVIETEYTPEQLYKIEQEKKQNKTKKDKELEEYQQIIKMLKKLLK